MKRTKWQIMVRCSGRLGLVPIFRRVMTDGERYFIKIDGEIRDVTAFEDDFQIF